ncbi:chromatin remodelling complex Rsc7/Swp82 subunit-domain-containing protein [Gymnopilus junonius]|uniref:Chromatin remodelling complex Rsc7/Swp82 subunit-domain-containing protein n=1 Tax=Gymnopilus junonius TaxID=109634 RepID=A0A9P5NA12_GYMJU|nr:chromatin remodelling complex Rsc7/Swp82 subunit-domain-containing protein [Gymnopilus junonius]
MSSVPKIVIRPRTSSHQNAASSSAAATPASQVDSAPEGDDDDVENDDSQAMDVDQEGPGPGDDNENAQGQDEDAQSLLGRGRGSTSAVSTPRARGRGRGRGRPRGRPANSLLIRLPKRNDDETEAEAEAEGENDADVEGGDAVEEHEPEKEAPLGGGKPFRKIHGEVYVIDGDEFITPEDPKGNEKIDQFGNLLGGRRFKAATFALPNRHPQRQYMLAIDAARTSGFRDSLYYFRRNLLAFKLNATQPEKDYLISEGKLGSHLRTRSVTLVTARSAFKLHGSKMIIDGRWVTDDYYETKNTALAPGMRDLREEEEEGEGEEELPNGDVNVTEVPKPKSKKRKVGLRMTFLLLVYTSLMGISFITAGILNQKYKWEALPDSPTKRRVLGGTKVGNGAWALAWVDTVMEFPDPAEETNTPEARERQRLLREAENSALAPIDLA